MRIFDQFKRNEIKEYDLSQGYLQCDVIHHDYVAPVQEQGHYVTINTYPNGGKDVAWIVDVAGVEEQQAYDEDIMIFVPYTAAEKQEIADEKRIEELKTLLFDTDYKAIKFAEGLITLNDYEPIRRQRQAWRDEINQIENK